MIYLDNAASMPLIKKTFEALHSSFEKSFANPSAKHQLGLRAHAEIEQARAAILASLKGEKSFYLYFTASATEANNTIIKGVTFQVDDEILLSFADHPSLVVPSLHISKNGVVLKKIFHLKRGEIDLEKVLESCSLKTKLIILSSVNNQSGVLLDLPHIVKEIRKKTQAHIHLDFVQSYLKHPLDLESLAVDSLSLSAHKIGGPKGVGGLLVRHERKITPLLHGGGQESGLRSSTQSHALIMAFAQAVLSFTDALSKIDINSLSKFVTEEIKRTIPSAIFPFEGANSPFIITFIIPGISSDIILRHLEEKEIYLSSTSACSSKKKGDYTIFDELHIAPEFRDSVLRLSLSPMTTKEELIIFIKELQDIYNSLAFLIKRKR